MTTPENGPPVRREPPEPPDLARVDELRRRLRRDRRAGGGGPAGFPVPGLRSPEEAGP